MSFGIILRDYPPCRTTNMRLVQQCTSTLWPTQHHGWLRLCDHAVLVCSQWSTMFQAVTNTAMSVHMHTSRLHNQYGTDIGITLLHILSITLITKSLQAVTDTASQLAGDAKTQNRMEPMRNMLKHVNGYLKSLQWIDSYIPWWCIVWWIWSWFVWYHIIILAAAATSTLLHVISMAFMQQ